MPTVTYQDQQCQLFNQLETAFKKGQQPSNVYPPIADYTHDSRLYLTLVNNISPQLTADIEAQLIEVEVDSTPGIHLFNIVGLPDKAVEESKDRIASAIRNSNLTPPSSKNKKIIINLFRNNL